VPVTTYGKVDPKLFQAILMQKVGPTREQQTIVPNDAAHTPHEG